MDLHTYSNGAYRMSDCGSLGARKAHAFCALRESNDEVTQIDAGYCIDAPGSMPAGSWHASPPCVSAWESLFYRGA
jgi:hypothetical protein